MAVKTITKTCPNCGKVCEQRSFIARGRTVTEEEKWQFGSPLRMCPSCKKLFFDTDIQELAITGPRKQDKALIGVQSLRLALMGAILAVLMYIAGFEVFAYVAAGVGALCLIADLALYPTRMKKLERERQASEKRLSDPQYVRMLKKAGYEVPEKYLK